MIVETSTREPPGGVTPEAQANERLVQRSGSARECGRSKAGPKGPLGKGEQLMSSRSKRTFWGRGAISMVMGLCVALALPVAAGAQDTYELTVTVSKSVPSS